MDSENFEDYLDLTDSEASSLSSTAESPAMFDNQQPLVLELHELKKDAPSTEPTKVKRHKKRKKSKGRSSESDSVSGESSATPGVEAKEEFYDAHESFHGLPENQQASPVMAVAILQAHSEHGQDPKNPELTPQTAIVASEDSPTPIMKPAITPK